MYSESVTYRYSTLLTGLCWAFETINLRDGLLVLPDNGLTFNEINDIIDFICTT
jgi:hypothetical protein